MAEQVLNTKQDYANRLLRLQELINSNDKYIGQQPQFSSRYNEAVSTRQKLVKDYLQTVVDMRTKFGVVGSDFKVVKTVPKSLTDLLDLANGNNIEDVVQIVVPQVLSKRISPATAQSAGSWGISATPAQIKAVKQKAVQGPKLSEPGAEVVTGPTGTTGPTEPTTGGGGTGGGTDKTKKPALPKNWEAQFRRMFPEQSWLLDLDKTKYPKLFSLIQRGISDRMYETAEGQQRFAAELRNTDFYVELRNTDKVRQIKSLVGDLGFDSVPFNKFLTTASNMGWEGETLQQEVYKEAFRKNETGQYVNPTAVTRAKASNNYLAIANIGKAYFSQVADSTVENALTGGITNEDVQRQQRELAKTKYGHLSNLIEQGLTLQELSSPFQQQAASILERSTDSIDMGQAMFEAAYNYGETGQKRMMTSGEWEILLRSDAKYGWDKTENAKREARQLASSISQAFGKVM
jgi:hypothetical protein